jgi:hypothetical protein
LTSLRLGGLSFPQFLRSSLAVLGSGLINLELQSVHFPIQLDLIGDFCPNIQVKHVDVWVWQIQIVVGEEILNLSAVNGGLEIEEICINESETSPNEHSWALPE